MQQNRLKNLYLAILIVLVGLIIATPVIVRGNIGIFREEIFEAISLSVLIIIGFLINRLYQKEVSKNRSLLNEALRHIGTVNVQIEHMEEIFGEIKKYPENKHDFRSILLSFSEKTLGIINSAWVLFRIIDITTMKTLTEHNQARGKSILLKSEVSNRSLVENQSCEDATVIYSTQDNVNIKVFCILPVKSVSHHQKIILQTIVDTIGMLYLIVTSVYYKNTHP